MTQSWRIKTFDVCFSFIFALIMDEIAVNEECKKKQKNYLLPNNFQLSTEIINNIVNHPSFAVVTKTTLCRN